LQLEIGSGGQVGCRVLRSGSIDIGAGATGAIRLAGSGAEVAGRSAAHAAVAAPSINVARIARFNPRIEVLLSVDYEIRRRTL